MFALLSHRFRRPSPPDGSTGEMWDLATVERIRHAAKTCTFCDAISRLLDDLEQAGKSVGPKMFCEVMIAIRGSCVLKGNSSIEQLELKKDSTNTGRRELNSLKSLTFRFTEVKQAEGRTDEARQPWAVSWIQAYNEPYSVQLFDDGEMTDGMTLFGGRRISPLLPIGMILSWKNECLSRHDASCCIAPTPRSSRISIFRLIDVTQRAVVRLSNVDITSLRYVALSYVWGKDAQKTTLTRKSKQSLSIPGALDGIVSKTIEDAVDLTKLLGLQYIWVDALCIVQDDIPDKSHHLAFMYQVYRYAEVTVIAASGKDANAGLPGLHEPRRIQQRVFKIVEATPDTNELCLITAPDIRPAWKYNYLEGSEWSSRGWTLQEKVMSRRTLIFTDTEV
ncbi:tol protein-like protein [Colletotrichum asianum]|uniref:Tol protein-like protein n=1 Tax=Colletotrichum asianum TaxID=702518 RepID=A0A8H3W672_9PEZI|nr:tol protein-like protein [Colletotrichum asianum]